MTIRKIDIRHFVLLKNRGLRGCNGLGSARVSRAGDGDVATANVRRVGLTGLESEGRWEPRARRERHSPVAQARAGRLYQNDRDALLSQFNQDAASDDVRQELPERHRPRFRGTRGQGAMYGLTRRVNRVCFLKVRGL
jgi:hypothetical protein